jgi:hypothetical protein
MIRITATPTGLTVSRDDLPEAVQIDRQAVRQALPGVLAAMLNVGTALADGKRQSYEDGLLAGRRQAERECDERERRDELAEARAEQLLSELETMVLAAPLAA